MKQSVAQKLDSWWDFWGKQNIESEESIGEYGTIEFIRAILLSINCENTIKEHLPIKISAETISSFDIEILSPRNPHINKLENIVKNSRSNGYALKIDIFGKSNEITGTLEVSEILRNPKYCERHFENFEFMRVGKIIDEYSARKQLARAKIINSLQ